MKKTVLFATIALFITFVCHGQVSTTNQLQIFKDVTFFDGYAQTVIHETSPEITRTNTLYRRQLTKDEINKLKTATNMQVDIKAACDNYDRLGSVSLYITPQGSPYNHGKAVELGRYITPFMDKNKDPSIRPYSWDVHFLGEILADKKTAQKFDFYIELSVFGVPYDAQKKVKGCEGRNDVFVGSLSFTIDSHKKQAKQLIPIVFNDSINNYNKTDTVGKTTKSYVFETTKSIKNGTLYLITSNHGANRGGEEYNRRKHFIYLDDQLIFEYIPGEETCEPYRKYNTQSNGIYGKTEKTNEAWQAFSNWCPGAKIPTRIVTLKNIKKGKHIFKIEVPDAKFVQQEGVIPLSAYIVTQ